MMEFVYPHTHLVAGVDEVGRGPLVGAVVTAAVILDPARPIIGLNDSKKLSEERRLARVSALLRIPKMGDRHSEEGSRALLRNRGPHPPVDNFRRR